MSVSKRFRPSCADVSVAKEKAMKARAIASQRVRIADLPYVVARTRAVPTVSILEARLAPVGGRWRGFNPTSLWQTAQGFGRGRCSRNVGVTNFSDCDGVECKTIKRKDRGPFVSLPFRTGSVNTPPSPGRINPP